MRKLIISMNVTMDGYMSGPRCELDWHFKYWSNEMGEALCRQLSGADTLLLGRITYQAMARYWPSKMADPLLVREDLAFAQLMNEFAKIVFSATLTEAVWNHSTVLRGEVDEQITQLKQLPGKDIMVYGSGQLVQALMQAYLVDEYQLWVHPVLLGKGKSLFKNGAAHQKLKLIKCEVFRSGVVLLCYQTIKEKKQRHHLRCG